MFVGRREALLVFVSHFFAGKGSVQIKRYNPSDPLRGLSLQCGLCIVISVRFMHTIQLVEIQFGKADRETLLFERGGQ